MKDHTDKRSVFTDALETLGTKIGPEQKRDAIHLAVIPVEAGDFLYSGSDVGIAADGKAYNRGPKHIGIVDPFLNEEIRKGEWFWLVIYPRKITSLRHVWTHPDVPDDEEAAEEQKKLTSKEASEAWLRLFIATNDCPDYETLIAAASGQKIPEVDGYEGAASFIEDGYLHFAGRDAHGEIPPEFWHHVEVVTGKKITERAEWFSCSC